MMNSPYASPPSFEHGDFDQGREEIFPDPGPDGGPGVIVWLLVGWLGLATIVVTILAHFR